MPSPAYRASTSGGAPLFGLASNNVPFGAAIARLLDNGTKADVIVQALEKRGLARRLAEPNLVALSGDTASFLAGGEFPFPVQAEDNKITVEFKKFGVGLAFTPTVLGGRPHQHQDRAGGERARPDHRRCASAAWRSRA